MTGMRLDPPVMAATCPPTGKSAADEVLDAIGDLLQAHFNPGRDEADFAQEPEDGDPVNASVEHRVSDKQPSPTSDDTEPMEWEKESEPTTSVRQKLKKVEQESVVADPVASRARELREIRAGRINMDQFKVQNGVPKQQPSTDANTNKGSGKGREARKEPWIPPDPREARFKDNRNLCQNDIALDKLLAKNIRPEEKDHRPPPRKVEVTCSKCEKTETVDPIFAPRQLESGDETCKYVCNRCIASNRPKD